MTLLAPDAGVNPIVHATADRVAKAWTALGIATTVEALAPGEFVERLRTGDYAAAVIDVNLGLDPDPYAILGSTQGRREGGSNVSGIQDATLDTALLAARAPGTTEERRKAYAELQRLLGTLGPDAAPVLPRQRPRRGPGSRWAGGPARRRSG